MLCYTESCRKCCLSCFGKRLLHHTSWRHVVLIAALISATASVGLSYGVSSSVSNAVAERYNISREVGRWTSKTNIATMQLFVPIGTILSRIITLKNVQLLGATAAIIGVGGASAAPKLWVAILLYGIIGGFGISMIAVAGAGKVREYFEGEHVHYGLSLYMAGLYLGILAFPPLVEFTFEVYRYQGGMLTLAPWMLIHVLTALTYIKKSDLPLHLNEVVIEEAELKADSILPSIAKVLKDWRVWFFALSGFFKRYVMSVFHVFLRDFLIKERGIPEQPTDDGNLILGMMAVMGIFVVAASYHLNYDRIWPQIVMPLVYGTAILLLTIIQNERIYYLLMGLIGVADGIQMGNLLAVANRLGGKQDMLFVLSIDQGMQGVGNFLWGFLTGFLKKNISLKYGIYSGATASFISALIAALIPIYEKVNSSKEIREKLEKPNVSHSIFSRKKDPEKQPLTKSKRSKPIF